MVIPFNPSEYSILTGGRGGRGKVNHKGQRRHFSDVDELKQQEEKLAKEKAWRV